MLQNSYKRHKSEGLAQWPDTGRKLKNRLLYLFIVEVTILTKVVPIQEAPAGSSDQFFCGGGGGFIM